MLSGTLTSENDHEVQHFFQGRSPDFPVFTGSDFPKIMNFTSGTDVKIDFPGE